MTPKEQVILELLANNGEMYGLEMVRSSSSLKRGTIYVTLGRMADKGLVTSRTVKDPTASGMPRRLFKASDEGLAALNAGERSHVFDILDTYHVNTRGKWAYCTKLDRQVSDFEHLENKSVFMRAQLGQVEEFICLGVEAYMHGLPWRQGENIALMVDR